MYRVRQAFQDEHADALGPADAEILDVGTGTAWPDLMVAAVMAVLALSGGWAVLRQARRELRGPIAPPQAGLDEHNLTPRERDVAMGLGTDGPGSNNSLDLVDDRAPRQHWQESEPRHTRKAR